MALDTLRATVWPPSDVPLDCAGRRLHRWRDRPVRTEFYYRWRDWRLCSGVAADRSGMVCAADGVPTVFMVAQERFVLRLSFKCVII